MDNFKYSEKQCEDFYQKLRKKFQKPINDERKEKIKKRIPDFAYGAIQFMYFIPDIAYLTIRLIFDKSIPIEKKTGLIVGFVYLVSPVDIIPDFIPYAGYLDDLIILTYYLNNFFSAEDEFVAKAIDEYWLGNENLMDVLQKIGKVSNDIFVTLGIDKVIGNTNKGIAKIIMTAWKEYNKEKK